MYEYLYIPLVGYMPKTNKEILFKYSLHSQAYQFCFALSA